jgi:hypothetical protein
MPDTELLQSAALNLLTRSLRLREHRNLLIVADQAALDLAELLMRQARARSIHATCIYAPREQQATHCKGDDLPPPLLEAIRNADGVLSCLADGPAFLPFRGAVLQASMTPFRRTLHAPGLTLATLGAAAVDYDLVQRWCSDLALPLVMGRRLEIISTDHLGKEHRLVVTLPGWDSPPAISDGVVDEGRWTNLPPGETFILPFGGDGAIAINGSLPGMVLAGADSSVLHFEHGRLVEWTPAEGAATRHLFTTQLDAARLGGDPNWSRLAEIGFGVNPLIGDLIGVEAYDEKKAGTVHIALGSNSELGGHITATIHCDLVVVRPTVTVDGRLLLENGENRLQVTDWLLDVYKLQQGSDADELAAWWRTVTAVHRTVARAEIYEGKLYRAWGIKSGRHGRLPVGAPRSATMATRVYNLLPENAAPIGCEELIERAMQAGIPSLLMPAAVRLLLQYDLVRVKGA